MTRSHRQIRRPARTVTTMSVAALVAMVIAVFAGPAWAACHIAAFSEADVGTDEGAGTVTLTVILVGGQPSCAGTVDFATADGSATAGTDYEAASGTLEFVADDDREEQVAVTILADDEDEGDEDFTVTLSNPTGGITGTGGPVTVTISGSGAAPDDGGTEPGDGATTVDEPTDDGAAETDDDGGSSTAVILGVVAVAALGAVAFGASRRKRG